MTDKEKVATTVFLTHCERCQESVCILAALSVKPLGLGNAIGT